ncbi:MAG: ribonuclease [Clostridia bacterium]|nr:ribonuclease [Clostridia bacterium]
MTKTPAPGPDARMTPTPVPDGPIIDPQSIADYIFAHGCLPDNFMTKKEAQALGFDNYRVFLSDVAPGMSIGGDWFGNYEKLLPVEKGVVYHEADCYYTKGKRDKYRIVYSSNGRVWYSEDHYNSFTELFPTAADAPEEQEGMKVPEAPEEPEEPETTPFSLWDWLWG